ncbi:carboxymuconolactone decarboxylase family protein [Erwinia sp. S63]|uniref:carboxymuconolactone decarboxylase family protein n=1 Tax=Erwinia sp. S63 TaxID=2769341 RepID=UPI001909FA14|nr:carboxymuconolactone decarboxylase family protein [Erwinia sp. S63]MBK0096016.1 carboxymuconolactone decarboxylase family protein [Erwinia sp. S63]
MTKSINASLMMCAVFASSVSLADEPSEPEQKKYVALRQKQTHPLTLQQKSIAVIAAHAATGNIAKLNDALNQGLDAGLTLSQCREVLVQLYAYAGFPRSLNALGELMKVIDARRLQGKNDLPGSEAGPVPTPDNMLAAGTRNQMALVGSPVKGPLFEFAPAIDQFLKAHLFGDIFARDNLDWKSRELATVGALAGMSGVESQLQSHLRISMNVGFDKSQLAELEAVFNAQGEEAVAQRIEAALAQIK